MRQERTRWIGVTILLVLSLFYLANLYRERERSLWDFKTYYYAAQAFRAGLNPYETETLSHLAGEEITLPFLYPPFCLVLFLPLTFLPYSSAFLVYFCLKIGALFLLLWIWRAFLENDFDFLFLPFALVVFNSAIPLDIASGNISVFEQILLWGGFLFLLRKELFWFCALVVMASLFKITPLFFLVLLLFSENPRKGGVYLVGSLLLYFAIHAAGHLFYPLLMHAFSFDVDRVLGDPESRGLWNPSTFALIRDIAYETSQRLGMETGIRGPFVSYLLASGILLFVSGMYLFKRRPPEAADKMRYPVCFLSLVYLLLVPRLQVYSYLMAIPPAYYFLKKRSNSPSYPLSLFFLMSLSAKDVFFPGAKQFYDFFWDYSPLIVVAFLWGIEICGPWKPDPQVEESTSST